MKLKIFIFILGAGLSACSFGKQTFVSGKSLPLDQSYPNSRRVDSIVKPYKTELDQEMNQVISLAAVDYINGRPSGNLGNLMSDILLAKSKVLLPDAKVICVINFGGLRAPISKGNITLGDVFKVMPFDNQLVLVRMPASSILRIRDYLLARGGEPIAGFRIEKGILLEPDGTPWAEQDFWVVTSDYLINGGDNMTFFELRMETIETGLLFRDVIIDFVKASKVLPNPAEQRIGI